MFRKIKRILRDKNIKYSQQKSLKTFFYCYSAENIEDEELRENLNEELKGMNIERLQLELNAVLMVGPEMQPHWL